MIDCTWIEWFKRLATTIAQNDEHYLAASARDVEWRDDGGDVPLLQYGDENIDPMSFLYFLAQRRTANQYERVFNSVDEVFGISDLPETQPFIPVPTPNTAALYHNGREFNPNLLWRLFRQAAPINEEPNIQPDDFNGILTLPNVGMTKLTQTLFLANPSYFLPADRRILASLSGLTVPNDYGSYVDVMNDIKSQFPGCHPYEINTLLDIQGQDPLITENTSFFQVSTNVDNDETDYWEWTDGFEQGWVFKENNYVYTAVSGTDRETYPLTEPRRGDIILVRFGKIGHAIGVVEENGYAPDGWNEDAVIYVYWINKSTAPVEMGRLRGFTNAGEPTCSAFRNTDAYKITFDLIDRWIGDGGVEPPPDPEPPAAESDTSFPLNTVLFGPPGTGKTWEAVSYAVAIMDDTDHAELVQAKDRKSIKARFEKLREEERVEFVTFHQNYTYEDFIEGIVPVLDRNDLLYERRDGVFKRISLRARDHDERHVLIIDEINRGNIAKIFGELITLIEPTKRSGGDDEAAVTLPYSQERFSVPDNLYLVGTMNTADRGIALLDTALRRRFDFIEKMPDLDLVEEDIEGVDGQAMLKAMNERITVYLGREHQIGHTYLIDVRTIDDLAETFQRRIVPLLQEYFYDDWTKIRLVLNKNPFIREREIETSIQDDRPERPVFELLAQDDDEWQKPESYRQIYADEQAESSD